MRRHQKQKAAQNAKAKNQEEEDKSQDGTSHDQDVSRDQSRNLLESQTSTEQNIDPEGAMNEEEAMRISGARWNMEKESASQAEVGEEGQESENTEEMLRLENIKISGNEPEEPKVDSSREPDKIASKPTKTDGDDVDEKGASEEGSQKAVLGSQTDKSAGSLRSAEKTERKTWWCVLL